MKRKTLYSILVVGAFAVVLCILMITVIIPTGRKERTYNTAVSLLDNGQLNDASVMFLALDGYKDSKEKVE